MFDDARFLVVSERALGTMVTYGYPDIELEDELVSRLRIGASLLEILPEWSRLPDPALVRRQSADRGLSIHSAHGCWGGRTIRARRVDLGATDPSTPSRIDRRPEGLRGLAGGSGRQVSGRPSRRAVDRRGTAGAASDAGERAVGRWPSIARGAA